MSTRLRRLSRRPAPQGVRPASREGDRPPDGWEVVDASWAERVAVGLDSALLRVADTAARATTRRAFIAGASGVGVALVGLGSSGYLWGTHRARANHEVGCNATDPNGALAGPCGPNPLCRDHHCRDDNGNCRAGLDGDHGVTWRDYGGSTCTDNENTFHNCWTDNCCGSSYNGKARCCDCCEHTSSGAHCSCGRHKCICRKRVANC